MAGSEDGRIGVSKDTLLTLLHTRKQVAFCGELWERPMFVQQFTEEGKILTSLPAMLAVGMHHRGHREADHLVVPLFL